MLLVILVISENILMDKKGMEFNLKIMVAIILVIIFLILIFILFNKASSLRDVLLGVVP